MALYSLPSFQQQMLSMMLSATDVIATRLKNAQMLLKSVDTNLTEMKVLADDSGNARQPTRRDLQ